MEKLVPIFTYHNSYSYSVSPAPLLESTITSTFHSVPVRLTPTCKYTRFAGPDYTSDNATILGNGEEVIFGKAQDYIYTIQYKITGGKAKFWRVYFEGGVALQIYDVYGNIMEINNKSGCRRIYGVWFPMVVELDHGACLTLKITASKYLPPEKNPFSPGRHCLNGEPVYENIYNQETFMIDRFVDDKYITFNEVLRDKYLSVLSYPCQGNLKNYRPNPLTTIVINSEDTLSTSSAFKPCYQYYWILINTSASTSDYFKFTTTRWYSSVNSAAYFSAAIFGLYDVEFDVVLEFDSTINKNVCGDMVIGIISYTTNKILNYRCFLKGVQNVDNDKITFKGTITGIIMDDQTFYMARIWNVGTENLFGLPIPPINITGSNSNPPTIQITYKP